MGSSLNLQDLHLVGCILHFHSSISDRDPALPVPHDEITSFPHAVLEVKLALKEGEEPPEWVTNLIESGMLTEVHKFSKFIHGCATLLPQQVMACEFSHL